MKVSIRAKGRLYYFRARYLDTLELNRFVSRDPQGLSHGSYSSLYAYANNNPLMFGDPTGAFGPPPGVAPSPAWAAVAGAMGIALGQSGGNGNQGTPPSAAEMAANDPAGHSASYFSGIAGVLATADAEARAAAIGFAASFGNPLLAAVALGAIPEFQAALVRAGVPVPVVGVWAFFGNEVTFVALFGAIGAGLGTPFGGPETGGAIGATVGGLFGATFGAYVTAEEIGGLTAPSAAP